MDTPPSLEQQMKPLLKPPGFAFVSGGLMSSGRIVVVNLKDSEVIFREGNQLGSSLTHTETRFKLSRAQVQKFQRSSADLFSSKERFMNTTPLADFDVILYLNPSSGKQRTIQAFGPAVGAVKTLYEQVWALLPSSTR
jgi:hypothetical protein